METNHQEMKKFLSKLSPYGKLREIDPDIPINQQMTFEEYIEQVYLCLTQLNKISIQTANERMQTYWEDFPEYYNDNWKPVVVCTGLIFGY